MSSEPTFDIEFEEDILAASLVDPSYLKEAARVLDHFHFNSKQHAWIWSTARDIWVNYKERATGRLLAARAKADFPKDEDRAPYLELTRKMMKRAKRGGSPRAALAQLELWTRKVNAQIAMEEAARLLDRDDKDAIDKVYQILADVHKRQNLVQQHTIISWIEEFEDRQATRKHRKDHPDDFTRIPTGFKKIDRILSGGIELGEFGNIMATTGKGKSIALINLVFACIRAKYPATFVAMEMPARQVAQRLDSRWLEMPYKKFKLFDFRPKELREIAEQLERAHKRFSGLLKIVSMPVRSLDIHGLVDIIETFRHDGHDTKGLFLDSADHMIAPKGRKAESFRIEQSEIYWAIKGYAEDGGMGVWNSIQAGRDWSDKTAAVEAASESYDKGRIADIMISLNTPKKKTRSTREMSADLDDDEDEIAEREAKITGDYMEAFMAKYRDGESHITIPLSAHFTRMYLAEAEDDDEEEVEEE